MPDWYKLKFFFIPFLLLILLANSVFALISHSGDIYIDQSYYNVTNNYTCTAFADINDSIIYSWNITWRNEATASGLSADFTNAIVNVSMLDNNTVIRTHNTTWFTTQYEAELPTCAAGEYTTSDGTDLTCDTPASSGLDSEFTNAIVNTSMFNNGSLLWVWNITQDLAKYFSHFTLENVSNDTIGQQELIDFNNSLVFSYFTLENVSNNTYWNQILNVPSFSEFTLENVSNDTIGQQELIDFNNSLPFTAFTLENITNDTIGLQGLIDFNNSLIYTTFNLENVSNNTWNIGDVATPSDGDTTHISTADQIYDYIVSLNYITNTVSDLVNYFTKAEIYTHIGNNITSNNESLNAYGWLINETDISVNAITATNLTIHDNTNSTVGNFSIIQLNSTCSGFRFNNSLDAGGLFSCMP